MLAQMTVWFSCGVKYCWYLGDLINNECPYFVSPSLDRMHTQTRADGFTFIECHITTGLLQDKLIHCVLCGNWSCHLYEGEWASLCHWTIVINTISFQIDVHMFETGGRRKRERAWQPEILPCCCQSTAAKCKTLRLVKAATGLIYDVSPNSVSQ